MQCPACATVNPAQARFCLGCGSPLVSGHVCTTCHTLLPPNARYCFHCGSVVVATANTCQSCGAQLIAGQPYCSNCGAPTGMSAAPQSTLLPTPRIIQPIMPAVQPQTAPLSSIQTSIEAAPSISTQPAAAPLETK